MALRLRHFLYLDAGLVEQDLSQVRGAVYGKGSVRTSTGNAQGFGGQLGSDKVASLKADKNKTRSEETEVEFQPSPEAAFNELYDVLDGAPSGITPLSNLDASIWNQLSRGDALEVEAVGTLPLLSKVARVGRVAEELSQVMKPMAELFHLIGHEDADSTTTLVNQMGQYGKASAIESDSEPILNLVIAVRAELEEPCPNATIAPATLGIPAKMAMPATMRYIHPGTGRGFSAHSSRCDRSTPCRLR